MSSQPETERELVARCLAKHPGAWSDFVDRFVGLVYHVIQHTAHHRNIPLSDGRKRELCAEVFAWLLRDKMAVLRKFKWQSNFVTYLAVMSRRIVVHRLIERTLAKQLGHVSADPDVKQHAKSKAQPEPEADEQIEEAVLLQPDPSGPAPAQTPPAGPNAAPEAKTDAPPT